MRRRKKAKSARGERWTGVVRAFSALGIAVCFFLPWISVSCEDRTLARSSGFDLLEGRIQFVAEGSALHPGGEPVLASRDQPREDALWIWAGAAVLLVVLGIVGAAYSSRFASGACSLLAAALLALYGWFFAFGFKLERELEVERAKKRAEGQLELSGTRVAREPAWHVSAGLAGLILIVGLIEGSGRRK